MRSALCDLIENQVLVNTAKMSTTVVTCPQTSSLLILPLEIRFIIYELVMLFQPGRGKIRSYRCNSLGQIQRDRCLGQQVELDCDQGLFLVNRQIYFEMKHMMHVNPLRLTVMGNLRNGRRESTAWKSVESLVDNQQWVRRNTRELRLQLESSLEAKITSEIGPWKSDNSKSTEIETQLEPVEIRLMLANFWTSFLHVSHALDMESERSQVSLQPSTKILSTFPNIRVIELLLASFSMTWPTFWSDLTSLVSSNPRCSLKIVVPDENSIIELFWFLQRVGGQLLMTSTWQYGEHCFCVEDVESKTWRRSGLDVGVRWGNCWRILEEAGEEGLSVEVLIRE